jgi:hypothetical protein
MDDREKTILDLKKLEERDKSEAPQEKPGIPAGVPPDGADIESPAQHKAPRSVEEYLKSLAEAAEKPQAEQAAADAETPHAPPGGHVHFRVAPPKSNAPGHFP